MQEDDLRASNNVEDRRGMSGGAVTGGLGIGAIVILSLIGWATGIDPRVLIGGAEVVSNATAPQQQQAQQAPRGAPTDQVGNFVARVLGETEDVWSQILPQQGGRPYEKPLLVLFSGVTQSGCGTAQSAMGPFYCPIDRKLYLDTSFFQDMQRRMGGGGDFAYAYVIAHEVGPPRAEPDRAAAEGAGGGAAGGGAGGSADVQPGVGAGRADGGLPGWRLGQQDERAAPQHRRQRPAAGGGDGFGDRG